MSERDTEIDEMRWDIFRECLEFMIEGKEKYRKRSLLLHDGSKISREMCRSCMQSL